jgi:hypothetical protein
VDDFFAALTHTPRQHFALYFYAALLRVIEQATLHFGSADAAHDRFPFLGGYFNEIAAAGLDETSFARASERWLASIDAWERAASIRLPLVALRHAADLRQHDLTLLAQIGLPDEDPRFGVVFDALQGGLGLHRPTIGLLGAWQSDDERGARSGAYRLQALGLVEPVPGDSLCLRISPAATEAIRGGELISTTGWAEYRRTDASRRLDTLALPDRLRVECERLARILDRGAAPAVVLRGPRHNGRRTLAGAIASAIGKGILEVSGLDGARDPRWRTAASLACLLDASLLVAAEPGPSESFELPDLRERLAPFIVTLGVSGGVAGALSDRAITLRIPPPSPDVRAELWRRTIGFDTPELTTLRLTSGNIVRSASVARAAQELDAAGAIDAAAVRAAVQTLDRSGLEALAQRVECTAEWSSLAASSTTLSELTTLAARCRQRERLGAFAGPALSTVGPGVRALFKGPSGTGKTLAARLLAGTLGMDLYRVDLSAVVNKYIGETEKNLERVFARAEELDVMLLLDEGDALLTQRTGVQSANDRYANLETNYLLQRLESYEGILIVTTNAGDHIDSAFQRRMDVVIDFALPDAAERFAIWQLHLPARHQIDLELLHGAVQRCSLSGGQIRNVALHAALLAAEADAPLGSGHFECAVEREYRKQGGLSPLRVRAGRR